MQLSHSRGYIASGYHMLLMGNTQLGDRWMERHRQQAGHDKVVKVALDKRGKDIHFLAAPYNNVGLTDESIHGSEIGQIDLLERHILKLLDERRLRHIVACCQQVQYSR
jgi:hypothetical protein